MSLAAEMVATYFRGGRLSVALASAGAELSGRVGYRRARNPAWEVRGADASIVVPFGPFTQTARFDSAWLMDGERVVRRYPLGEWQIPAGGVHSVELLVSVDDG